MLTHQERCRRPPRWFPFLKTLHRCAGPCGIRISSISLSANMAGGCRPWGAHGHASSRFTPLVPAGGVRDGIDGNSSRSRLGHSKWMPMVKKDATMFRVPQPAIRSTCSYGFKTMEQMARVDGCVRGVFRRRRATSLGHSALSAGGTPLQSKSVLRLGRTSNQCPYPLPGLRREALPCFLQSEQVSRSFGKLRWIVAGCPHPGPH